MDNKTIEAKKWLDKRYTKTQDGRYFGHQPIYGYDSKHSEPNVILRLARTYQLLKVLSKLSFESFLDIGGGEGYTAALVSDLFGAESYSLDISTDACLRAREMFHVRAAAADSATLPVKDKSYDLVLCSEVIEHLSRPVLTMSELKRVARKYVVLTTYEFCSLGKLERWLRLNQLDAAYPHEERNWFTTQDFKTIFSEDILLLSQMDNLGGRIATFFEGLSLEKHQIQKALSYLTRDTSLDVNHDGVIVVVPIEGGQTNTLEAGSLVVGENFSAEVFARILSPITEWIKEKKLEDFPSLDLIQNLICPACRHHLILQTESLQCAGCKRLHRFVKGVPEMFLELDDSEYANQRKAAAIAQLAGGDQPRTRKLELLWEFLHGDRPITMNPFRRSLAGFGLRLLWFYKRPGNLASKARRVIRRVLNKPPSEFDRVAQIISEVG